MPKFYDKEVLHVHACIVILLLCAAFLLSKKMDSVQSNIAATE